MSEPSETADTNPYRHDHNPLNADFHGGHCSACDWARDELPRVYVASKARLGSLWREQRDAWEGVAVVASTWIDEFGEGESNDLADLWRRCIEEASTADLLIACHVAGDVWKGAYIEIGAALAAGIPVYICGNPPGSWMNHPLVTLAASPDDALNDYLSGIASAGTDPAPADIGTSGGES